MKLWKAGWTCLMILIPSIALRGLTQFLRSFFLTNKPFLCVITEGVWESFSNKTLQSSSDDKIVSPTCIVFYFTYFIEDIRKVWVYHKSLKLSEESGKKFTNISGMEGTPSGISFRGLLFFYVPAATPMRPLLRPTCHHRPVPLPLSLISLS